MWWGLLKKKNIYVLGHYSFLFLFVIKNVSCIRGHLANLGVYFVYLVFSFQWPCSGTVSSSQPSCQRISPNYGPICVHFHTVLAFLRCKISSISYTTVKVGYFNRAYQIMSAVYDLLVFFLLIGSLQLLPFQVLSHTIFMNGAHASFFFTLFFSKRKNSWLGFPAWSEIWCFSLFG